MKKFLSILMVIVIVQISLTVYATPVSKYTYKEAMIKAEIKSEPDSEIFILLISHGADINDDESIYAIAQIQTDQDGIAVASLSVPDHDAVYDLYVDDNESVVVAYARESSRDDALSYTKEWLSQPEAAEELLIDTYAIAFSSFGMDTDLYRGMTSAQKENVGKLLQNNVSVEALTKDNIGENFNKAIAITMINDGAEVERCLSSLNPTYGGVSYNDITEKAQKQWINDNIRANRIENFDGFDLAYDVCNILYLLNNAKSNEISRLLAENQSRLWSVEPAEYTQYKNLLSKTTANSEIVNYFRNHPCKSIDVLKAALSYANSQSAKDDNKNPTGGVISSSGGGGGSGGGLILENTGTPTPTENVRMMLKDIGAVPWAKESIAYLYDKRIVNGDENGYFNPDKPITREEFVTMMVAALGFFDKDATCYFKDVPKDSWFYPYVASAYRAGLVNGMDEYSFGAGRNLSRQDMMVLIYRAYKDRISGTVELAEPADIASVQSYATEAVIQLFSAKIVNGIGNSIIDPDGISTKAQCAVILTNLLRR